MKRLHFTFESRECIESTECLILYISTVKTSLHTQQQLMQIQPAPMNCAVILQICLMTVTFPYNRAADKRLLMLRGVTFIR